MSIALELSAHDRCPGARGEPATSRSEASNAVAYRLLDQRSDADDVVQDAWIGLSRSNAVQFENLGGGVVTQTALAAALAHNKPIGDVPNRAT
ncbi:MAG TPA: sigma factor [Propionibacteriaceae bacterium]